MAYTRLKKVNGHDYLEIVESFRENGKVRHRYLRYIGAAETPRIKQRNKTFAIGINGLIRYEFELKIVDATKLMISHAPFTFAPNPDYPVELQPRIRDRAAARLQVMEMAAKLDPDALLDDFRSLDRGSPIVGNDGIVESGNGCVMAILLTADQHPEIYATYRKALKALAPKYALPFELVDEFKIPVLVRERITVVDRRVFVQECNNPTTMESSPVEKAKIDATRITIEMLTSFEVLDGETITDAIHSIRNNPITTAFLSKLSANEQACLLDAHGALNQDGVVRIKRAIFASVFKGDAGLRLSECLFESTDEHVSNCFNGILKSLGILAKSEALISRGYRQCGYSISEDLAEAISELAIIKNTLGLTLETYLAQSQMLDRKLTVFQESVLTVLAQHCRSAKQISAVLSRYCQLVIDSPPPSQRSFISDALVTKEDLFETAVKKISDKEVNNSTAS